MQRHYDLKSPDWLDDEHESTLTSVALEPQLETMLEMNIDTELE